LPLFWAIAGTAMSSSAKKRKRLMWRVMSLINVQIMFKCLQKTPEQRIFCKNTLFITNNNFPYIY
jgi:hypothetical protein